MVKEIKLGNGKISLVDDEDFELLNEWSWRVHSSGYVIRQYESESGRKTVIMHRVIMNAGKGTILDHINGDKLDNRKANLRFCTIAENSRNKTVKNVTGFKGVAINKKSKKSYIAQITVNRKHHYLGSFSTPEEAARAYNEAALKYHGEFARLNEL